MPLPHNWSPLFDGLSPDELALVTALSVTQSTRRGQVLFREGEPGAAVYFVQSGAVRLSRVSADGKLHMMSRVQPGEVFAEAVLFSQAPYPATAEVVVGGSVARLDNTALEELIHRIPQLGISFLRLMSTRLLEARQRGQELATGDVAARVRALLRRLAKDGVVLGYTREELASMAGTTRETFTRLLLSWQDAGLVDVDGRVIGIAHLPKE